MVPAGPGDWRPVPPWTPAQISPSTVNGSSRAGHECIYAGHGDLALSHGRESVDGWGSQLAARR